MDKEGRGGCPKRGQEGHRGEARMGETGQDSNLPSLPCPLRTEPAERRRMIGVGAAKLL